MSMRWLYPLTAACLLSACDRVPIESASAGAAPAVAVPIGPPPGPITAPETARNPYGDRDPVVLMQGKKLFGWYNCAGCHGPHGGGGMGPALRDDHWRYGSSDAAVFDSIAAGRSMGMPAWGLALPASQIWQIVAYVKSLGTDYEPKPPVATEPKVDLPPDAGHPDVQVPAPEAEG